MPASPSASAEHIMDVNWRYHDVAASSYDSKWGIDFGAVGQAQVRNKLVKALGAEPAAAFGDGLEIGAGTGYFSLNLLQSGLIENATATDISPGMLAALSKNAGRLRVRVTTRRAEADRLPFRDESFDLVFGHAVLHHLPHLAASFEEFRRVLRPGGTIAFCGEPSRYGDLLALLPKTGARLVAPLWRAFLRARSAPPHEHDHEANGHALEGEVDVHAFDPGDLRKLVAGTGFEDARVQGEELLASMHGWTMRTLEASAEPDDVPMSWRRFAFNSYMRLQRLDAGLLEPHLPAQLFYNLLLSARKPV